MNDCQGCKAINMCGPQPFGDYMKQGKIQRCPCKDCIVKVICDEECDRLKQFVKTTWRYWNLA